MREIPLRVTNHDYVYSIIILIEALSLNSTQTIRNLSEGVLKILKFRTLAKIDVVSQN
jgi:hypothetical protein